MKNVPIQRVEGAIVIVAFVVFVTPGLLRVNADLVHHYTFDDGTANDSAGTVNGVAGEGATLGVAGKYGQGVSFGGTQDGYVKFHTDNAEMDTLSDAYTIAYWRNTAGKRDAADTQDISGWSFVMGHHPGIIMAHGKNSHNSAPPEGANLRPEVFDSAPISINYLGASPDSVPFGSWHHVAIAGDQAANRVTLYVDGVAVLDNTSATDLQTMVNNPEGEQGFSWIIGSQDYNQDRSFHGTIDDLRIYNTYLTESEIYTEIPGLAPRIIQVAADSTTGFRYQSAPGSNYVLQIKNPETIVFRDAGVSLVGDGGLQTLYDPGGFDIESTYRIIEE